MSFRRLYLLLAAMGAAASAWATSSDLLPGSISFVNADLWGKTVRFGFDDNGTYAGKTYWYSDCTNDCALIRHKLGTSHGQLEVDVGGDMHRTLKNLAQPAEKSGPAATTGLKLATGNVYFDSKLTLGTFIEPFTRTDSRDKLNCWVYVKEDGSVTNFIVTAGEVTSSNTVAVTNYVTDASVVPGEEIQLTIKAIGGAFSECPDLIGFEVYINGLQVSSGDRTVFPSAVSPTADDALYLHSFGFDGLATAENINVTHSNPIGDPEYDYDDVTMLRESATITISGFPAQYGVLYNFPVLVRVSEANISGFYYSRCSQTGLDIRFTDENGKLISFEIESWDRTGESLVWVKVPYFTKDTKITMHWGQQSGTVLPSNDRYAVWSEYVGVWHFAQVDGKVSLEDSCGNGHDMQVTGNEFAAATMIGGAAYASGSTGWVANYSSQYPTLANCFTFSGWYTKGDDTHNTSKKVAGKNDGNVYGSEIKGWSMTTPSRTTARFYGDNSSLSENNVTTPTFDPTLWTSWGHVGLVYDSGSATAYANGTASEAVAMTISVVTNELITVTTGLKTDELRLSKVARSAAWMAAECGQVTNTAFLTYGTGDVKDRENYWIVEPSASPQPPAVSVDEASTLVFSVGTPRHGYPVLKFYDASGTELLDQPTTVGTYKAVVTVEEGAYEGLRSEIAFVIFEKRAYRNIEGYDRIQLFNSDVSPLAPVSLQGYNDVDAATNTVWIHDGSDWWDDEYLQYVENGTHHYYYQPNTEHQQVLWQYLNCRVGNLFIYGGDDEPSYREDYFNYLPWGANGQRILDSEKSCDEQHYAGVLMLQNRSLKTEADEADVAAAYSPLYTNGIGTIYFDAVNAVCDYENVIKVQVCNYYYDKDEPWYAGASGWRDVPVDVFAIVDGVYDESLSTSGVTEVVLKMDQYEGTSESFYRIRASIGVETNVRFRIVRNDDYSGWGSDEDDPNGFIEIDNIVVSYPGMGAAISQYGAPAEADNLVLRGQRAPFDVAFPTAADLGSMHAQVKVDYLVNNTNEIDTSFVGAITFRYRWRYLNQLVNDWRELTLAPCADDPTRWMSSETIEGEGTGDIEYNATAIINAPYYVYWDYAGLGWVWPDGYSERYPNQQINAELDGVYSESNLSPALGTDYFVRLRDGASEYEGMRVILRRTNAQSPTGVSEETLDLEPWGANTWRGFYNVLTNGLTNVFYRVELYNRQAEVGVDYQWNTNYLHGANQSELPASDVLESGDTNDWARIPCDELTGRIMFQFDDTTLAGSIIHADYQNFNAWSDAMLDSGLFLGTSTEGGTSGVSRLVRDYACGFGGFQESVASNSAWRESFILTGEEVVSTEGEYAINIPFGGYSRATPNAWSAYSGMWVCERYRELGGKSLALQLDPAGYGQLTMNNANRLPRGVEVFEYMARTTQTYDVDPFNYYNCATNQLFSLPSLTFAVPCAMRITDIDDEFHGQGSVSAVIRYKANLQGYEVRADRIGSNTVQLCLYKWNGGTAQLIGSIPTSVSIPYSSSVAPASSMGTTGTGNTRLYGALVISASNTANSVRITAGILVKHIDGSYEKPGQQITTTSSLANDCYYNLMSWEDTSDDRFTDGTVGVGSKECPAVFARPVYSRTPIAWRTDGSISGDISWNTNQLVKLPDERALLDSEDDYQNWNIFTNRLMRKELSLNPKNVPGFKAKPLTQVVYVNGALNGAGSMTTLATNYVSSFGFVKQSNVFRDCHTYQFQIQVGGEKTGAGVVVDDVEARQWRGEDYDDQYNPDRLLFDNYTQGAPTNFVYTTAWVDEDNGPIELAPLRTLPTTVMSIRSPLMDGNKKSNRGLGLGAFSFRYENADSHARLLIQICTNSISITSLADMTKQVSSGWETVKTVTFDQCSEEELAGGLVSCYIGLHGVTGVMRVIVDPTVVTAANDASLNPGRDPSYGRIYITMVAAKDNPKIDSGSWWGWNLRTTDEGSRQLLKDGDLDPRLHGLSYALNNSVTANTREGDIYVTHKPFLQTPILSRGSIGEVSFKARKYSASDPPPSVAIYAMTVYDPGAKDSEFVFLTNIVINCERYERFSFIAPVSANYTAFRFAVTGVEGVEGDGGPDGAGPMPESGYVRRVMLDEVSVFEALKARLGFRKVGAFRNMLGEEGEVPNVPSASEQPICNESWGVQAEIYPVRLSEKIDYSRTPRVFLHWFQKIIPWGYDRWMSNADAHTVELKPVATGSLVYRSSLMTCPEAVLPSVSSGNTTVQYTLEVVYYMQDQSVAMTNLLESSEWSTPEWYRPIDYNSSKGQGQHFSAYTIIDSVPPGWAWINEINLFGSRVGSNNSDLNNQYIEVAVPVEANLKGWTLRLLTPPTSNAGVVHTNNFAKFGTTSYGGLTLKSTKDIKYAASNMVFLCVASPLTKDAGTLSVANGTLDGCWVKSTVARGAMKTTGEIEYFRGLGFQLIRPSGIVEHELVAIGTNYYTTGVGRYYNPTNALRLLNEKMTNVDFFYAGSDDAGKGKSLGVFDSFGESSNYWNNVMAETPGRINEVQFIDPDHPTPIGSFISVYFNLLSDHIYQTVGTGIRTNVSQVCVVRKGSAVGTNVVYDVDKWYELADVSSSDGSVLWTYTPNVRQVTIAAAVASSNNSITVTASAQVSQRLRDLGCDEQNRYTPAIIDWLEKHTFLKDVYGLGSTDWPDSDGEIYLANYMGLNRKLVGPMTLTQMYWLDICPTVSNQCLVAGMAAAPSTKIVGRESYEGTAAVTNKQMSVFMMITNTIEDTTSAFYGKAWSPYVLRGLAAGSHSLTYGSVATKHWTNETFKITGILANGYTDENNENAWVPQRYFVFNENSFSNFISTVQVPDPHSSRSLGYQFGWGEWWRQRPDDKSPVFFSWSIDQRSAPVSVEVLKSNDVTE